MFKKKLKKFVQRVKELNGDPHYVALGLAIGVFIAITPTIPFHTAFALGLAFLLKASKPAAILGVWVSNPVTVVFLYIACYKAGFLFFDHPGQSMALIEQLIEHLESDIGFREKIDHLSEFMKVQMDIFLIMNVGGIILGLPAGVGTYFLSKRFFLRLKKKRKDR